MFTPSAFDVDGYLDCLRQCRERFHGLDIRSAIELGEPHWHPEQAAALIQHGGFDLVVAALRSLPSINGGYVEVSDAYLERPERDVLREYLAETGRMIENWDHFDSLAHIDYAVRSRPSEQSTYQITEFEDDYRTVLGTLARKGAALEVNTRLPLDPRIVTWWREEGGSKVTFGSDVHDPHFLARGFIEANEMPTSCGYGPRSDRHDLWALT